MRKLKSVRLPAVHDAVHEPQPMHVCSSGISARMSKLLHRSLLSRSIMRGRLMLYPKFVTPIAETYFLSIHLRLRLLAMPRQGCRQGFWGLLLSMRRRCPRARYVLLRGMDFGHGSSHLVLRIYLPMRLTRHSHNWHSCQPKEQAYLPSYAVGAP